MGWDPGIFAGLRQAGAAAALLARRTWVGLAEQCMLRWRTFVAEGLAMQVLVMRERLQRADAECCLLRGEEPIAHAPSHSRNRFIEIID